MAQIILDATAGQISQELARCGIAADTRVHAVVDVAGLEELPMAATAQTCEGFAWLAEEPDLYSEADRIDRVG